jgi:hypothetical protein
MVTERPADVTKAEIFAGHSGVSIVERIVAHCSPGPVMVDFQSTFDIVAANQPECFVTWEWIPA